MDALVPVVVGGLLAVAGGLIGAWVQGRREHTLWVRQERLAAYYGFLRVAQEFIDIVRTVERAAADGEALVRAANATRAALEAAPDDESRTTLTGQLKAHDNKFATVMASLDAARERNEVQSAEVIERATAFFLIGPRRVENAANAFSEAMGSGSAVLDEKVGAIQHEMRRALGMMD